MSRSSAHRHGFHEPSGSAPGARLDFTYTGTAGDDRVRASLGPDQIDVSQGGDDQVFGFAGDDTVYFGAAFTGADRVRGGTGFDIVTLDGDYSAGVDIQADSLVKIEQLVLEGGSYLITGELAFKDDLNWTYVDGTSLAAGQSLHISVQSLGDLQVLGGAGDDVMDESGRASTGFSALAGFDGDDLLIGGAGEYHLQGGYGADRLISNSDETRIDYFDTLESAPKNFDTIAHFQGKLLFTFDSDTSTEARDHDFHFGKTADRTGDILVHYNEGKDETILKVFTDADHKADFVVHLTGDVHLTPADFIFG